MVCSNRLWLNSLLPGFSLLYNTNHHPLFCFMWTLEKWLFITNIKQDQFPDHIDIHHGQLISIYCICQSAKYTPLQYFPPGWEVKKFL